MAYQLFRIHPGIPGCLFRLRVYMFLFHFLFSSLLFWFGLVWFGSVQEFGLDGWYIHRGISQNSISSLLFTFPSLHPLYLRTTGHSTCIHILHAYQLHRPSTSAQQPLYTTPHHITDTQPPAYLPSTIFNNLKSITSFSLSNFEHSPH